MIGFLISRLFYYLCILKSEFDIVAELSCVYGEIDTPTEKERAEINEINSRTAMNYINSGAVSPDEIRNVLREDTNSAFNALEGDAPNDPIDFDPDNDPFKGVSQSEAQCLALSETVDDRRYDRSDFGSEGNEAIFDCTGGKSVSRGEAQYSTHDEWNETDHPRKPNGQFGEGGGSSAQENINLTGEELGKNLNGKALRDKAAEYYKVHLANTKVKNPKIGTVIFSQSGHNKPISSSKDERKLRLIPALPKIISSGTASDIEPDKKQRPNVKGFYTIRKELTLNGEKLKVRVSVREDNNGKLYYDHAIAKPVNSTSDSPDIEEINIKIDP